MTSKRANRYPPELRERAVRMLMEQRSEYRSEYAAINSIAPTVPTRSELGCASMNEIWGPVMVDSQATSACVLKNWSRKLVNCVAATIFCDRPQLILRRRSSTVCGKNNAVAGCPQR